MRDVCIDGQFSRSVYHQLPLKTTASFLHDCHTHSFWTNNRVHANCLKKGAVTLRISSHFALIVMSWPPRGLSEGAELSREKAELLISKGALVFEGLSLRYNHTLIPQPRFYASVSYAAIGKYLEASSQPGSTVPDASLVLSGQPLEQPSMVQCFGASPGTITLGRYINAISSARRPEYLPKYKIKPRATDNLLVLQRLHYLMKNGWDEDVS